MNNISKLYIKIMENVRGRVIVRLLMKWEGRYNVMIAIPNFHSRSVFSENGRDRTA